MKSIRAFFARCLGQLFKSRRDCELDEEFKSHLQLHIDDNLRDGMSPAEARRAALLKFTGGIESAKEDYRDQRGIPMIENLLRDVRYASRSIRKSPAFTIISVLTIGIGVGATASMFSIADSLLFRPLPVVRPGELLTVRSSSPTSPSAPVSYRDYLDLRERNRSFQNLAAFTSSAFGYSRSQGATAQMKYGIYATSNFFPVLGITPPLGRGFLPGEEKAPVRNPVVVLSHSFWKTEFASDPAIIGKSIRINGSDVTVVGVAPESFTGVDVYMRPAFYLPLGLIDRFDPDHRLDHRDNQFLMVKGRLKQGVSFLQARAELATIASALQQAYPDTNRNRTATIRTELSLRVEDSPVDANLAQMLLLLAACVLLVACANVAGLLLSRSRARSREIAVRLAIGSSRFQLIRQLLIESLLIALGGGVAGLAIGYAATLFFSHLQVPSDLPIIIDIRIDHRAMLCALAAAMLSALLFGLAPAIRGTRPNLVPALKTADADLAGPRRLWGRNLLVVAQVALSLMLLTVSGFLYRGFAHQMDSGPGFRTDQLLMMSFNPNLLHQDEQQTRQFYRQLKDRVKQVPGVEQVAFAQSVPFAPNQSAQNFVPESFQLTKDAESAKRGFTLRGIISNVFATRQQIYGIPRTRLILPPQLDDERQYDFAIVPPQRLTEGEIISRVQMAIQRRFHLRVARETESREVYVLAAPNGPSPAMRDVSQELANLNVLGRSVSFAGGDISGSNVEMSDLTYMLERTLQEIVVDETNLKGRYDFKVPGKRGGSDDTIAALREKLGLVLTRDRRAIEVLVVKPE